MIYKISPHPSFPKRGKEREIFAKEGKEREIFAKEGERKGRNDPLDYAKTRDLFLFRFAHEPEVLLDHFWGIQPEGLGIAS